VGGGGFLGVLVGGGGGGVGWGGVVFGGFFGVLVCGGGGGLVGGWCGWGALIGKMTPGNSNKNALGVFLKRRKTKPLLLKKHHRGSRTAERRSATVTKVNGRPASGKWEKGS